MQFEGTLVAQGTPGTRVKMAAPDFGNGLKGLLNKIVMSRADGILTIS